VGTIEEIGGDGALLLGDPGGWEEAFGHLRGHDLGQHWRPHVEEGFQPGRIRLGRKGEHLWVLVNFTGSPFANTAAIGDGLLFQSGDVCELFVQDSEAAEYHELHVTPENVTDRLLIPSREVFDRARREAPSLTELVRPFRCPCAPVRTWSHVDAPRGLWRTLVEWPLSTLAPPQIPEYLRVAVARYAPHSASGSMIVSSTAPHSERNFHRPEEWPLFRWA